MSDQNQLFDDYNEGNEVKTYVLRLFITGASPNSIRAVENVQAICEEYLAGNYQLEIIDIHQQPQHAESEDVIAVPLLLKKAPYPERRLIGDMSDKKRVLKGLGIADTV
jgi:circadian clock protein KaiB